MTLEDDRPLDQSESETSAMTDGINYTDDLPGYVLDSLFDNLTDKSY